VSLSPASPTDLSTLSLHDALPISRPPGEWQTYDIVFHGPRFDAAGKLTRPARATVFHNGVLVQDNVQLTGPTAHGERPLYKPTRSEEHTSELQSRSDLVCRLLLEK